MRVSHKIPFTDSTEAFTKQYGIVVAYHTEIPVTVHEHLQRFAGGLRD